MTEGILFIVATPIGNLQDVTLRALEVLKTADAVLAEDTRITKKLLSHYGIAVPTISYHQHSSEKKTKEILGLLQDGKQLALVTDAGTPGISDPGGQLVHRAAEAGAAIMPIPGPSAVIGALSVSGFPADKFLFLGFPPHKKGREKFFQEVADATYTAVFYESSHRIKKAIAELHGTLDGARKVVVCRELTKKFESIYRGTIAQIADADIPEKGEFVVVINR